MFDAIGTATLSFLAMAWALAQLAAILSTGAAVVYAAYRHYQLTKQATEIMTLVEARCNELTQEITKSQISMETRIYENVHALRCQLELALTKPEAVPERPKALPASTQRPATIEVIAANESATTPIVSNPY